MQSQPVMQLRERVIGRKRLRVFQQPERLCRVAEAKLAQPGISSLRSFV
jgi:hypothetical protein